MSCPSSIGCGDSNPQRLKHESSPITTRPGHPQLTLFRRSSRYLEQNFWRQSLETEKNSDHFSSVLNRCSLGSPIFYLKIVWPKILGEKYKRPRQYPGSRVTFYPKNDACKELSKWPLSYNLRLMNK